MGKMKWLVVVLLLVAMGMFINVRAEGQKVLEASSTIDRVMVYADRSLVTRVTKSTNLTKGIYEVTLRDLPANIQDDSVRASSHNPNDLKIIGLDIKTYQLERPPEEKTRLLQEQLQNLQDNLRTIADKLRLLQMEKEYLIGAKETFFRSAGETEKQKESQESPPRLMPKDYDEMLKYYLDKLAANANAVQSEELKHREIDKKIILAKDELSKSGIGAQTILPHKKLVKINLEVLKDGSYDLELSYINYGVRWQTSYDVRVLTENKEMEITSYGVVSQSSGEDWLNTQLSFSTAQPALQGWLPELPPLFATVPEKVQTAQYSSYQGQQMSQSEINRNELSNFSLQPKFRMIQNNGNVSQQVEQIMFNQYLPTDAASNYGTVIFQTPKRVDIMADGAPHRTSLWQQKFPVKFEYITIPKLSPYVYLKALGTNKMEVPILRGNINVFMGSDFIGNSQTTGILPGEEFELTLNVDENIRITRKLEEKAEQGPGFLGSTKKLTYSFLVKLENYRKENVTVTVVDQIPTSQDKDVTVELGKSSDKPLEQEKDGKLKWRFELKPKETKELTFSFSVSVPKDKDPAFFNADRESNQKGLMRKNQQKK